MSDPINSAFSLKLFLWVAGIAIAIIGVYDLSVCLAIGPRATITHEVRVLSHAYPLLKFISVLIAGYIAGFFTCHFFSVG